MPYLSHNYRYQPRPKSRNLLEAAMFVLVSAGAILLTLFILGWLSAPAGQAATGINQQINYQGKLSNSAGVQVSDAAWNFRFRIYDASSGGNILWTERWNSTTTQATTVNGVFSVALGSLGQSDLLSAIDWNSNLLYLQVHLDADNNGSWEESFGTRKRLTASPYAFNSDELDGFSATSTAAVASYLLALDASGNLNLFDKGVSSTQATTTVLFLSPRSTTPDAVEGRVYYNDSTNSLKVYDGTTWASVGDISDWEYAWDGAIKPTSTVGIFVNASSTILADLRVDGNLNITGYSTSTNIYTSGILHVGSTSVFDGLVSGSGFNSSVNTLVDSRISSDWRGFGDGLASLDGSGKVPNSQIGSFFISTIFVDDSEAEMLAESAAETGDISIRTDENKTYVLNGTYSTLVDWHELLTPANTVLSVNGQTGAVVLNTDNINEGSRQYYTDTRVDARITSTWFGFANKLATLGADGKLNPNQLPDITINDVFVVANQAARLALSATVGDIAIQEDNSTTYVLTATPASTDSNWHEFTNPAGVTSVNTYTGDVTLTTSDISEGSNLYWENDRFDTRLIATSTWEGNLTVEYNIGAGGINPSFPLEVRGIASTTDNVYVGQDLYVGHSSGSDSDYIYFDRGAENLLWNNTTGRFELSDSWYVSGSATTTGTLYVEEFASSTRLFVGIGDQTSTSTQLRGGLLVDSTTLVVNANENRVGIGTATPVATLQVLSTENTGIAVGNGSGIGYLNAGSSYLGLGLDVNADDLIISQSTGYVGIGDTSPLSLLTVGNGDKFRVDASGNATTSGFLVIGTTLPALNPLPAGSLYVGGSATTTASLDVREINTAGNDLAVITGAGSLGVATTTPGGYYGEILGVNGLALFEDNVRILGQATTSLALWLGTAGTANNLDLTGGDLYVQDDLEVDGTIFGTVSGDLTCTNCLGADEIDDIYLLNSGDDGTGLFTFSDLRPSMLNASTTNVGTLTVYTGSTLNGLTTATDLRPSMLNASTTNVGTLTVYTGSTLNGLTTATDLRPSVLNASSTTIGTQTMYGLGTFNDARFPNGLNASSTSNFANLRTYGWATVTSATSTDYVYVGWGITAPAGFNYKGDLIVSDDVFINDQATTSASLWVGSAGTATTLNMAGGDLYVQDDLEVDDDVAITGGLIVSDTPTQNATNGLLQVCSGACAAATISTVAGELYVEGDIESDANADIAGNLKVSGRTTTTSATSTDYVYVGWDVTLPASGFNYKGDLVVSDDAFINHQATTSASLWVGSAGTATTLNMAGGDLYVQDDLEVDDDVAITGGLIVSDTPTQNATNGLLQVCSGACAAAGNATVAGELYVEGDIEADGVITVDSIMIDGTTVGHTSDTDLLTFASGSLTVTASDESIAFTDGGTDIYLASATGNVVVNDDTTITGAVAFTGETVNAGYGAAAINWVCVDDSGNIIVYEDGCDADPATPLLRYLNGQEYKILVGLNQIDGDFYHRLRDFNFDSDFSFTLANVDPETEYFDQLALEMRCHVGDQVSPAKRYPITTAAVGKDQLNSDDNVFVKLEQGDELAFSFEQPDVNDAAGCQAVDFMVYATGFYYKGEGDTLVTVPSDIASLTVASRGGDQNSTVVVGETTVTVENLIVKEAGIFQGTLVVEGKAEFKGEVIVFGTLDLSEGLLYLSEDQAGTALIAAGATSTEVLFSGEYVSVPKITATAKLPVPLGIINQSTHGFRAYLASPLEQDLIFDWIALPTKTTNIEAPVIASIVANKETVPSGESVRFEVVAADADTEQLNYTWEFDGVSGELQGESDNNVSFIPDAVTAETTVYVYVTVSDGIHQVIGSTVIKVTPASGSNPPEVEIIPEEPPAEEPVGSSTEPLVLSGCIDSSALNYNQAATQDDGSCIYQAVVEEPIETTPVDPVVPE